MIKSFLSYLSFERKYSAHTVSAYENDLKQFVAFQKELGNPSSVENLMFGDLRAWVVSLMDKGLKERTINRKTASLNAFYTFLQRKELRTDNPAEKLSSLKTPKVLPVFVKQSEMSQLLGTLKIAEAPLQDRLIMNLLYGTGIRSAELIGLRWPSVDLAKKQLKVLGKRNKERIIPVPEETVLLLREHKLCSIAPDFVICTDKGEKAYPLFVYRVVNKYLSLTDSAQRKSPHVLRHSYATHLLDNGADLHSIKELLGHASLASTQVYTHNSIDRIRQVFERAHPRS